MKPLMKLAVLTAAFAAFGAAPALASHVEGHDPGANKPEHAGKPEGKPSPQGKAYGWYCRAESRKPSGDGKGTPFRQCVRSMAKLEHGRAENPRQACAGVSRHRVEGMRGTPFRQCIRAAAHQVRDMKREEREQEEQETTS